jgi:glycosidase
MPKSVFDPEVLQALRQAEEPSRRIVDLTGRQVEIPVPFPSPADWRDRVVYFAMTDRFANPTQPPRQPWDEPFVGFQGGTFEGLRQPLGYLEQLGVGAIWLTPVQQNCLYLDGSFHGYGIQHFLRIDPRLASDRADPEGELRRLIDEAHARGIHVIFDIVLNHAGDVFAYRHDNDTMSSTAEWRGQRYPVRWRGADGSPVDDWADAPAETDPRLTEAAAVWPQELRRNAAFRQQGKGGEGGGDFESLKELVSSDGEIRRTLILCCQYLIAKFDVDGFRIDTLKYIEPDFALVFGNAMREFALEIGKRNFFTFGEVYDDDYKIARFIGRNAGAANDLVGVDAALDFPLFFRLPSVAKGMAAPAEIASLFHLRKQIQQDVVSSHGEASRYFVTFLDNHDQRSRFRHSDPADPDRYDDQVTLGLACLFCLQGIPCLYYGTEQGLSGAGNSDAAVREALWAKPGAFDTGNQFFRAVQAIAGVRASHPALRYGRQYFRPISGDGRTFGLSPFSPGVLAFSRILNDEEVVIVANTNLGGGAAIHVIVDAVLNRPGTQLQRLYSNRFAPADPGPVTSFGDTTVLEPDGRTSHGTLTAVLVTLAPGEVQILGH